MDTGILDIVFPGDPTDHNVVYQLKEADEDYHKSILFSISQVLKTYGDNVTIVVTVIGKGIHTLAKNPKRPVSEMTKERINSLSHYGVKFHACGNTLKSLGWSKDDLYDFVEIVPVGAIDLIELQEKGYSYISW